MEVELVGGAVEESGDGGAFRMGLKAEFRNVTLNRSPIKASLNCFQTAKSLPSLGLLTKTKYKLQVTSHACRELTASLSNNHQTPLDVTEKS